MKLLNLLLLAPLFSFAQQPTSVNIDKNMATTNTMYTKEAGALEPIGSKYASETFLPSRLAESGISMIKYNGYTDQIEFQTATGVQSLVVEKGKKISTTDGRQNYTFLDYTTDNGDAYSGYLSLVSDNSKVKIYSRFKIIYQPESAPSNGYEGTKPATYKKAATKYYIQVKDNPIVYLAPKKKELLKLFPGKETEISAYLKDNKLSDKEEDMKKLGEFLNTL